MSRIVARRREALLEEWLPGVPLSANPAQRADLIAAGLLLGRLHRTVGTSGRATRRLGRDWVSGSVQAAQLVGAGWLTPAIAAAAVRIAGQRAPATSEWGFCHGDFCAENLLRVRKRGLCLIDNETISELWQDYDLARTWYRWEMEPAQFEVFLDAYREYRRPDGFLATFHFWTIAVLLRSAVYRVRNGVSPAQPIDRLVALVANPSRWQRCAAA